MKRLLYAALLLLLAACSKERPQAGVPIVVGTLTDGGGAGLYSLFLDTAGVARKADSLVLCNPTYFIFSPDGAFVYAVSETADTTSCVSTIRFNRRTGAFTLLESRPTESAGPCHLASDGRLVVASNYAGGTLDLFPIEPDGTLAPAVVSFQGTLAAVPQAEEQRTPHIHGSAYASGGAWLYYTDFSADKVRGLGQAGIADSVSLPAGSGPRHLEFSADGTRLYVLGELSGEVSAYSYDGMGHLSHLQTVTADTAAARGSADLHLSPDGRFLYTSHRLGPDGITVFSVDGQGLLQRRAFQPTGQHPRQFAMAPRDFVLVACRDANAVEVYRRNPQTGLLAFVSKVSLPQPMCVQALDVSGLRKFLPTAAEIMAADARTR